MLCLTLALVASGVAGTAASKPRSAVATYVVDGAAAPAERSRRRPTAASTFNGQTVQIVVEVAGASTASLVEAAIDDVRVTR